MADNKVNSGLLEFSEDQKVFVALDAETSEVKKAVTIDEDGVETDMLGVQPTGKKEITTTAEVNVANYATAQVVDEDLVAGNIKKDVDILGVVGTYEPEAPASDFSTAEVTITTGTLAPHTAEINVAFCVEENDDIFTATSMVVEDNDSVTLEVVLYKGCALAGIPDYNFFSVSVSGNITNNDGVLLITGDGTITVTPAL